MNNSVTAAMKRKLNDPQVSQINLKAGKYHARGGYFVQKTVSDQEVGVVDTPEGEVDLFILDAATAGLAIGASLLAGIVNMI